MNYGIAAAMGYLLGCFNMAFVLSRLQKAEIQDKGSGNLGASNAAMLLGWRAGLLVCAVDVLKAVLAVALARCFFPEVQYVGALAGVAAVLGHIFPFYLKFHGGKGFASFLGLTLALNWKFALVILAMIILVSVLTDYIVCGTVTTVVTTPLYLAYSSRSVLLGLILTVAAAVILIKHRENYQRIRSRTEIGVKSALRGDHRIRQK